MTPGRALRGGFGIGVATSIDECLQILGEASASRSNPGVLARLTSLVGWK
jgi:hypothetical protein